MGQAKIPELYIVTGFLTSVRKCTVLVAHHKTGRKRRKKNLGSNWEKLSGCRP